MKNLRRAFTLIELLVVIAIIAILAAILFPVFAQAKLAAKAAASISNVKQISGAALLYSMDSDGASVLVGNTEADAPYKLEGTPYKPWSYLVRPYSKNDALMQDPLDQPETIAKEFPGDTTWSYRTQYGYAFSVHAPSVFYPSTGQYVYGSRTGESLARPADTVMFLEKKARKGNYDWYYKGSAIWGANVVNPPGCVNSYAPTSAPASLCAPNTFWGSDAPSYTGQTYEEGATTGGVALRKRGRSVVAWADGHVTTPFPERLAAGTNWTPKTPYAKVAVTDRDRYVWDAE